MKHENSTLGRSARNLLSHLEMSDGGVKYSDKQRPLKNVTCDESIELLCKLSELDEAFRSQLVLTKRGEFKLIARSQSEKNDNGMTEQALAQQNKIIRLAGSEQSL